MLDRTPPSLLHGYGDPTTEHKLWLATAETPWSLLPDAPWPTRLACRRRGLAQQHENGGWYLTVLGRHVWWQMWGDPGG